MAISVAAYCPHCETTRKIIKTVDWQANICAECGTDIPDHEPTDQ